MQRNRPAADRHARPGVLRAALAAALWVLAAHAAAGSPPVAAVQADPAETPAERFARSCALCHADGRGGAPRIGDRAAWRPRLATGIDALVERTVSGVGRMPPLGYCMDCERADFRALVELMGGAQ